MPEGAALALFWGGLWDWMDPALAVRAVSELATQEAEVHLVFLAGARPGGDTMRAAADEARRAAHALGVVERVHFLDRWVPYAERGSVLAEADLAVTAHRPSLETELAFRTRLLDCLWARLPPACTRGDTLAEEAEREGWGSAADAGDPRSLADAMAALLEPGARARARRSHGAGAAALPLVEIGPDARRPAGSAGPSAPAAARPGRAWRERIGAGSPRSWRAGCGGG